MNRVAWDGGARLPARGLGRRTVRRARGGLGAPQCGGWPGGQPGGGRAVGRDRARGFGSPSHAAWGRAERNSNRTRRGERNDASAASGRDEAYRYDLLNRLIGAKRGVLPDGQGWTYVAPYPGDDTRNGAVNTEDLQLVLGNWTSYQVDANGDGDCEDEGDLNQSRTHNAIKVSAEACYTDYGAQAGPFPGGRGPVWLPEKPVSTRRH